MPGIFSRWICEKDSDGADRRLTRELKHDGRDYAEQSVLRGAVPAMSRGKRGCIALCVKNTRCICLQGGFDVLRAAA